MKGILSISDIKNKNNNKEKSKEEIIKKAQAIGIRQMDEYVDAVNNFINTIRSKEIFTRLMNDALEEQIEDYLIDKLLEMYIKPIFKGDKPLFVDEDEYLEIRQNMYDEIIKKNNLNNTDNLF